MTIRKGAHRKSITVDDADIKIIEGLAEKRGMTEKEWYDWAIQNGINESLGQYGIAGLSAQRLNQIQDSIVQETKSVDNLSDLIIALSKMMNNLMAGSSYLNDADENDLSDRQLNNKKG